jgi:hypothetical protein
LEGCPCDLVGELDDMAVTGSPEFGSNLTKFSSGSWIGSFGGSIPCICYFASQWYLFCNYEENKFEAHIALAPCGPEDPDSIPGEVTVISCVPLMLSIKFTAPCSEYTAIVTE